MSNWGLYRLGSVAHPNLYADMATTFDMVSSAHVIAFHWNSGSPNQRWKGITPNGTSNMVLATACTSDVQPVYADVGYSPEMVPYINAKLCNGQCGTDGQRWFINYTGSLFQWRIYTKVDGVNLFWTLDGDKDGTSVSLEEDRSHNPQSPEDYNNTQVWLGGPK